MEDNRTKIIVRDIEKEMEKSFIDYSMSVIVSRALPDVRDGLKPVHRRILYTMWEKGLEHSKPFRKAAETVGAVLGSYHPHGDSSVYDALVRMAQDFSLRYPLIEGQGNFGSIDGDPPAAYRYTEARMSRAADHLLQDLEKETVDYTLNYNDTTKEPTVLPARTPNLLANGSTGIAVGMATNIPPHNMGEVIDGALFLLENDDAELAELMEYIQGPDFPTGGMIMGRSGIRSAYATGRGKIILRGRTVIEELKNGKSNIIITEIPYMVNKAKLQIAIADLVKDKRIDGIADLWDESSREGMRVVIELKRDVNPQLVLNQLYRFTQLQDTVGVIMLALSDGVPKVMNLHDMLREYLNFQRDIIVRRTTYELRKAKERAHILEGLKIAQDNIDEVIKISRTSKTRNEIKERLSERFGIDDIQASAIVAMQIGQLAGLEREKIESELNEIKLKIEDYEDILANDHRVVNIIKEELGEIRRHYKDARRTEIAAISGELDIEDLIPVEDGLFTYTHFGYIKRQAIDIFEHQKRGGRGVSGMTRRDEDFVQEMFIAGSHDYILFITDRGVVHRIKGYQVPESSRNARGTNIVNILPLEGDEKISEMLPVSRDSQGEGFMTMVTAKGIIKRTPMAHYSNIRKNGLRAITLDEGDRLAFANITSGEDQLLVCTHNGMAVRFVESDARSVGRIARGVRALRLGEGDSVVGVTAIKEGETLLTVTEGGKGRRSNFDSYRLTRRGGKGIKNYNRDLVAGIMSVGEEDDVIMISESGIIIRMHVADITCQSRYGGGVRVMRLGEGDKVVTVVRTERSEDSENLAVPDEVLPEDIEDVNAVEEIEEVDEADEILEDDVDTDEE